MRYISISALRLLCVEVMGFDCDLCVVRNSGWLIRSLFRFIKICLGNSYEYGRAYRVNKCAFKLKLYDEVVSKRNKSILIYG